MIKKENCLQNESLKRYYRIAKRGRKDETKFNSWKMYQMESRMKRKLLRERVRRKREGCISVKVW
jgi:hypothetical protein